MEATPIKAVLEDFKRVKTRGQWQIILEIPEENYPAALQALGNPLSGKSIYVAIVRINPGEDS